MQTQNSITYDDFHLRYNDYYGKLLSIYNYKEEQGWLYSFDLEKLHEISYLLILSRTGKKMDLMGRHKLHAFGVRGRDDKAILGIMPSKGGKSTLLLEFLKDSFYSLISDDTPVITRGGKILSFPLRIGLTGESSHEGSYELKREYFGLKKLISLEDVSYPVAMESRKAVLFWESDINQINAV